MSQQAPIISEEEPEPEGIYQDHPRIPKDYFLLYIQPCIAPPS